LPAPILSKESRQKIREANLGRPVSLETRKKLSNSRIEFLRKNPEMVPYRLNHYSKGRSYPEEYWKVVLESNGINFKEQYKIGVYQLDFAIVDKKIDLEIDGDQHYLDERIVESDKRRNAYLEELGWTIIRVKWSAYQKMKDKKEFVSELMKKLMGV